MCENRGKTLYENSSNQRSFLNDAIFINNQSTMTTKQLMVLKVRILFELNG